MNRRQRKKHEKKLAAFCQRINAAYQKHLLLSYGELYTRLRVPDPVAAALRHWEAE